MFPNLSWSYIRQVLSVVNEDARYWYLREYCKGVFGSLLGGKVISLTGDGGGWELNMSIMPTILVPSSVCCKSSIFLVK